MANPLKVLTDLHVSGTTATSGSIEVAGNGSITIGGSQVPTVAGVSGSFATPAAVSASFATPSAVSASFATLTGVSGSFATPAAVSASFATPAAVSASFATPAAVSASFATPAAVTASVEAAKYAITGSAVTFASNVTVAGNLTVQGTTTSVDSQTVNIGDKSIALASGSTTLSDADGAGFSVGSGSDGLAQFQYNHASTAFKSSENLNLATGKAYKVDDATVLSKTALGSTVVSSSLETLGTLTSVTVGGISTLSGAVLFKTDTDFGLGTDSLVNLTGTLAAFSNQLNSIDTSVLLPISTYRNLRSHSYAGKGAGSSVQFLLSGTIDEAAGNGTAVVTASCPTKLSGTNSGDVLNQLRFASFDVATKDQGSSIWTNDLVSVQIAETQRGSLYFPLVTVDAPALTSGAEIRLIVVYEATNEVM